MRFDRFIGLIGEEMFEKLRHKQVVIFGLGGVGSYVAEAIARSGIERIIICDFDQVEPTNINRQLLATDSTTGMLKTEVMEKRILDINPNARVLTYPVKADKVIIEEICAMNPDFIADAIDDIEAKTYLIKTAIKKDIPIISSMGFANKLHPELVTISTLNKTSVCPLAKTMRRKLKDLDVTTNFPVVYSMEKPIKTYNKEFLGTSPYVPSVAGLTLASFIVNRLIGEHL
jgi:tRNA A37 threonylcarbamoyladenosine dehydratase